MDDPPRKSTNTSIYIAGAGLIALAIAAFVVFGKDAENSGCALATTGIVTISEGLTKGHSASSIMTKGALAGTIPGACKSVVADFVAEPEAETEFQFVSPEGEVEESASGIELTESVAEPPETDASRVIDCFLSYRGLEFLYRMCMEEVIEPTS